MFSQLIDIVTDRTNRIDMRNTAVGLMNGIIRRIQSKQYFQSDLKQMRLTEDTPNLKIKNGRWEWTRTPDVRLMSAVQYLPDGTYPPNNQPSVGQDRLNNYWYKVGDKYIFVYPTANYVFEEPDEIEITYYSFSPEFSYIAEKDRLIKYDWETNQWLERPSVNDTKWTPLTEEQVEARQTELAAYGNWLMRDYKEVVLSGTISKLFGLLDDGERFKREFAEFNELFNTLTRNERYANFGYQELIEMANEKKTLQLPLYEEQADELIEILNYNLKIIDERLTAIETKLDLNKNEEN